MGRTKSPFGALNECARSAMRAPAIDRRIGLGVPVGQRLQRALRRPPDLTPVDKLLTAVYALWEAEPHLALGWLRVRHPARFRTLLCGWP